MIVIKAYIMVECETGSERQVLKKMKKVKWIEELYPLFGEYDFIIHAHAKDPDILIKLILKDIRSIKGVKQTETFLETTFT